MRALACSLRQVRCLCRLHGGALSLNGLGKNEEVLILCHPVASSSIKPSSHKGISGYLNQTLVLRRALSTPAANEATKDVGRAGPLLEYERRIASGELIDGDSCQVGTLRVLQRLYEQLIEHQDSLVNSSNEYRTSPSDHSSDHSTYFRAVSYAQAYAAAKFADACLQGLRGDAGIVECSFVASQVTKLPFFASKVQLGWGGAEEVFPLGPLSEYERLQFLIMLPC